MLIKMKIQFAANWANLKEQLTNIGRISLTIFLLFALGACNSKGENMYINVYYIPFKIQTYTPVTIQDIERRAFYKFKINSESELSIKLVKLLESKNRGKFDDKVVRLKVKIGEKIYYVDSEGNIKKGERITKVNTIDIEELLGMMIKKYKIKKTGEY
ncbi:MAG: hypothetical protein HY776_09015 [Actinobacteria bacterium]|nr:hypothetical protein [Actinomycetota bacterium]